MDKLEHLKAILNRLNNESLPSLKTQEIQETNLTVIANETMRLASRFINSKGYLTDPETALLKKNYNNLVAIVPQLEKIEKQYFASLRHLAKEVLDKLEKHKLPDSEVEKLYEWKGVYNQIKDIVNEVDFLGVADIVEDEYDDLNFKIYSQLLKSKDDSEMFKLIKAFVESYYEIQLSDKEINLIIEKLKLTKLT